MNKGMEKVYNIGESRYQYCVRVNNQTIKVKPGKIDSDRAWFEDKRGYRYARKIYPQIKDWWYFEMI